MTCFGPNINVCLKLFFTGDLHILYFSEHTYVGHNDNDCHIMAISMVVIRGYKLIKKSQRGGRSSNRLHFDYRLLVQIDNKQSGK